MGEERDVEQSDGCWGNHDDDVMGGDDDVTSGKTEGEFGAVLG